MQSIADKLNEAFEDSGATNLGVAKEIRPENPATMRRSLKRYRKGERSPSPEVLREIVGALNRRGYDASHLLEDVAA